MRTISERLEALRTNKARTACIDDRLYAIDGKICELADILTPRGYQQEWLTELKERQQILDTMQQERRTQDEEEERQLLGMIERLQKPRMRKILRLLYIDGMSITAATAIMYADHIKRTGKPATAYTATMHRGRLAAIARLEQMKDEQEHGVRAETMEP